MNADSDILTSVELDINMLTQLRGLLNDEPEKTTVNIVKDFGEQRFG